MTIRTLFVITLWLTTPYIASAQSTPDSTSAQASLGKAGRPRVGLVLSGGGAKGTAHVGVLKVLEKAGIPVDFIAGTSMGSIVGGLYASGYSASQLDSIVKTQDWKLLLSDKTELSSQSLAEREREYTYLFIKPFHLGKKEMGDMGFIRGRNITRLFEQLVGTDSISFRSLAIPFACASTDIVDNTEYDFFSGRLAQAMRASMAIPGVFSPVRIGNHVLVDGGLRNNYPADLARQMGADIIIGVSVQSEERTVDDLKSTTDVLRQIVDVNCKNKYEENWEMSDVKIRVNTKGYNTASFTSAAIDTMVRRGEEEAMRHWEELMDIRRQTGLSERRMTGRDVPAPRPATAEEDDRREASVAAGVRFDNEERVALQANLNVPFRTKKPTNIDLTLRFGKRIMARAELIAHRPAGRERGKPKVMSHLAYTFRHDEINIYDEGNKAFNFTYNRHQAELSLVNFYIRNFNFDLGTQFDFYDFHNLLIDQQTSYAGLTLDDEHFINYHARLSYSSENDWYFPTRGSRLQAQYVYHTDNFTRLDHRRGLSDASASWRTSIGLSRRFTLQPMVYGRLLFGPVRPVYLRNMIGGEWFGHYADQQMPFAGIGHMELTDPHFLALQMQGQERIGTSGYALVRLAAAQHGERLNKIFSHHTMWGIQAGYYHQTLLGPVGATLGYSNRTQEMNFYLNLGFVF